MKTLTVFFIALIVLNRGVAQHKHATTDTLKKLEVKNLFHQVFTDSIFGGKAIQIALLTVPAGAFDTTSHVHDCHLVGYVLEGRLVTRLKGKEPQYLNGGDVFYEFPNEVHKSLQNLNGDKEARILLYYLFKDGAILYKRVSN